MGGGGGCTLSYEEASATVVLRLNGRHILTISDKYVEEEIGHVLLKEVVGTCEGEVGLHQSLVKRLLHCRRFRPSKVGVYPVAELGQAIRRDWDDVRPLRREAVR